MSKAFRHIYLVKIALASICVDNLREICCKTTRAFKDYCDIHGYDCVISRERTSRRPPSWDKITLCRSLLPKYDWIFWIDSDCCILNMNHRLEDIVDDAYDFIIAKNVYGINAGVWLIKSTPWAAWMLDKVWEMESVYYYKGDWEQSAIQYLCGEHSRRVKIVPQRVFNSQIYRYWPDKMPSGEYQPGDFVLHFAGIDNSIRKPLALSYLNKYYDAMLMKRYRDDCRVNRAIERKPVKKVSSCRLEPIHIKEKIRRLPRGRDVGRTKIVLAARTNLLKEMASSLYCSASERNTTR